MSLIQIYEDLAAAQDTVLRRYAPDEIKVTDRIREGLRAIFGEPLSPEEAVRRILHDIRQRGDAAVREWTERIDGVDLADYEIPAERIAAAKEEIDPELLAAMETAADRIEQFHQHQSIPSWIDMEMGGTLGQIVRPLGRVGIYVPGGTAPLPSSLLMAAIPARVAGVPEIIVTSPPMGEAGTVSPIVLAAAAVAGVDRVFCVGGAQAIGAMAYGTESLPQVDKICGPGNLFVTLAKRQVFGVVGIDGLPGPTETLIIADDVANPENVAADLLAQAEHDVLASAILLTPSRELAEAVQASVDRRVPELSRSEIITTSLEQRGGIVLTEDVQQAIALANDYAAEHLCLDVRDPWSYLELIHNAGGIFVGSISCEVLGDYVSGPSHIMPTSGTARFASPQNVFDFCKITSLVALNASQVSELVPAAVCIAEAEGLTGHAAAAQARAIASHADAEPEEDVE